jgi:quinoprotein dehydrogenase-associated probable ABC transporter substrate-binding protein
VCADPDNLPLSNDRGEGYENRIAARLAQDLHQRLEYTYFPQRMGFVRNTLRSRDAATQQFKCDLIMGVPTGHDLTATTQPYLHSTYALVVRPREGLTPIRTPDDLVHLPPAQRAKWKIGIFARSPGADWLLRNQMFEQAVSYAQQSGDPHANPASVIEQDLREGRLDAAIVWGPVAGYLIPRNIGGPRWQLLPFQSLPGIRFDYEISMGMRFEDKDLKAELDAWIASHEAVVNAILRDFGVPLIDGPSREVN